MIDLIVVCTKNIKRKKLRSLLTVISIAIGVGSVVLISSIGNIGRFFISNELSSLGMDGLAISTNARAGGQKLYPEDLEVIKANTQVSEAAPMTVKVSRARMRGLVADTVVWGIDQNARNVVSLDLVYGRMISAEDVSRGNAVCMVDERVAEAFYKRGNIVGKTVTLDFSGNSQDYEIVGIVTTGGNLLQNVLVDYVPGFIYLPHSSMATAIGQSGFDQIAVKLNSAEGSDAVAQSLITALERNSGLKNAFKAENLANQKDKLSNMMNIVTLVLTVIAGVSLVVAGLGIMTVMIVSVNERTREIGIKKSIGASKRTIMLEFLVEAFTLSLAGGVAGCALGVLCILLACWPLGLPMLISLPMVGGSILFSVVVGVLFGVYPAKLAAEMRPVDALRFE